MEFVNYRIHLSVRGAVDKSTVSVIPLRWEHHTRWAPAEFLTRLQITLWVWYAEAAVRVSRRVTLCLSTIGTVCVTLSVIRLGNFIQTRTAYLAVIIGVSGVALKATILASFGSTILLLDRLTFAGTVYELIGMIERLRSASSFVPQPSPMSQLHMGMGFLRHCEPFGQVPTEVVVALISKSGLEPSW